MNKLYILFLLFITVAWIKTEDVITQEEDGVTILTDQVFKDFIKSHDFVLVKFFAPWCGHCQKLAPEYSKAAKYYKENEEENVVLAQVDATKEEEAAARYGIRGYPTLKFFVKGRPIDYKGERTEKDIINWIEKKTSPTTKEVKTVQEVENLRLVEDAFILYIDDAVSAKKKKNKNLDNYKFVSMNYDDLPFLYAFSDEIVAEYKISETPAVILLKQFDEKRNDFPGIEVKIEKMKKWIDDHRYPFIMEFNDKAKERIFDKSVTTMFYMYSEPSEKEDMWLEAAEELKEKIVFCKLDMKTEKGKELSTNLGVSAEKGPYVMILFFGEAEPRKYLLEETITKQSILKFFSAFVLKKLPIYFKSEPIPQNNKSPVIKVVAKNFDKIVKDSNYHVLVKYYAPWCGHCKALKPIYEKFAMAIKQSKVGDIIIAEMDSTENEVSGLHVNSYPTLKLYLKNKKDNAIDFSSEGAKDFASLEKFLKKEGALSEKVELDEDIEEEEEEEEVKEVKDNKKTQKKKKDEDDEDEEEEKPKKKREGL